MLIQPHQYQDFDLAPCVILTMSSMSPYALIFVFQDAFVICNLTALLFNLKKQLDPRTLMDRRKFKWTQSSIQCVKSKTNITYPLEMPFISVRHDKFEQKPI